MKKIAILTDSKYVADAINKWIDLWKENGWKDARNKQIINETLLKELAVIKSKLSIKCIHIKGHSNDTHNDEVDRMAIAELEKSFVPCGLLTAPIEIDQSNDPEIREIIEKLATDINTQENFVQVNQKLYFVDPRLPTTNRLRLVVPKIYRQKLIKTAHDDPIYGGHLGIKKTYNKLHK